jgi:hypothetical protein
MRISLVRISLLRFFKTFQIYLAYAFLGLFISLLRFLCLANAILGLFISLLRFFGQKICLMRFYLLFILLLRSLGKNLPNAIFG